MSLSWSNQILSHKKSCPCPQKTRSSVRTAPLCCDSTLRNICETFKLGTLILSALHLTLVSVGSYIHIGRVCSPLSSHHQRVKWAAIPIQFYQYREVNFRGEIQTKSSKHLIMWNIGAFICFPLPLQSSYFIHNDLISRHCRYKMKHESALEQPLCSHKFVKKKEKKIWMDCWAWPDQTATMCFHSFARLTT